MPRPAHVAFASAVAMAVPRPVTGPWVSPASAVALQPVTFPTTPLRLRALIALGADPTADPATWLWEDIAEWVRYFDGLSTTFGRADESSVVRQATARLRLDNRDGRFTRRNPNSPYYGLLSRNTPIWLTIDPGDGDHTRFQGFVAEWPTRWDRTGNDSTVPIVCGGVLRRLQKGEVLKSPLRRRILSPDEPTPIEYWPCEDGAQSTTISSGLLGGRRILVGTPRFSSGIAGSDGALDLVAVGTAFSIETYPIPLPSVAGFQVELAALSDLGADVILMGVSGGTDWEVPVGLVAADADGLVHHKAYRFLQNGADIDVTVWTDGVITSTPTLAGLTIGPRLQIWFPGETLTTGTVLVSHIAIYDFASMNAPTTRAPVVDGYAGEQAHVRMARVCAEESVQLTTGASTSTPLGPQPIDTLLNIIRDAEKTDVGVLYETGFGLGYQALSQRYNAPVAMAIDWGQLAEPPEPADDDQQFVNRWTARQRLGSEASDEDANSIAADGINDDADTFNPATADQLQQIASWLLHRDTVDEDRWPSLALQFARNPELIGDWSALAYGARLTVADPFPQAPPDDIDTVVEGHSERWDQFLWEAALITAPATTYEVHQVEASGNRGRVDAANSTLVADVSDVATAISVASPAALWRTGTVSFDIGVGGERMTVTGISGGSSPQTFTVTRSVNGVVKAQSAIVGGRATKVSLWRPGVVAL